MADFFNPDVSAAVVAAKFCRVVIYPAVRGWCGERVQLEVADEIGDGGAGTLKKVATEAINEMMAPIRARRLEIENDQAYVQQVLRNGIARANAQAEETLREVHEALDMVYLP